MILRRRMFGAAAACPYITDGLVFWLDGIDKGTDDTTKWVDLVGGVIFTQQSGNSVHDTNCMTFDGSQWLRGDRTSSFDFSSHTLEVAIYPTQAYWQGIIHYGNNKVGIFQDASKLKNDAQSGYELGNVYTANNNYLVSSAGSAYVRNGTSLTSLTSSSRYFSSISTPVIGTLTGLSLSYGYKGKIYAIRIYSRYLTAAEMLANQKVDNERFNLGLTLPDSIL